MSVILVNVKENTMNSAKLNLFSPISYMHEQRLIIPTECDDQILVYFLLQSV